MRLRRCRLIERHLSKSLTPTAAHSSYTCESRHFLTALKKSVVNIGLGIADGSMDYEALLAWVREHRV